MKYISTLCFVFLSTIVFGQKLSKLYEISNDAIIPEGEAIIYGNFIQRLGFSSGGFPQDIRLINVDTKEICAFRVKPTFKSAKENTFIFHIKPGKYAILNYWWTQSKWYGGKMFTEPIYKHIDATNEFNKKLRSGQIKEDDLVHFTFTITENSLNYLGTWHFDKGLVSFSNNKSELDNKIANKYKKLNFSTANLVLPE